MQRQWLGLGAMIALVAALAAPASAQDAKAKKAAGDLKPAVETKYDAVTLNNGDTLRGTIKGADADQLTLTQALGDELVLSPQYVKRHQSTVSLRVSGVSPASACSWKVTWPLAPVADFWSVGPV